MVIISEMSFNDFLVLVYFVTHFKKTSSFRITSLIDIWHEKLKKL